MKIIKIFTLSIVAILLFALEKDSSAYLYGQYLFTDIGSGAGSYRDAGTSPLTYEGASLTLGTGYLSDRSSRLWEFRLNTNYTMGFVETGQLSHYISEDAQLSYLHTLAVLSHPNMNLKAGGRISGTLTGSMNDSFENASFNINVFAALTARAQYTYAFIKPEKVKKRRTIPASRHALVCNLELPVILFNARPEYSYVIDGNAITLDRHMFLGGFSLQSNLAFRSFLPNGNAFDIAYIWKMYMTGKKDIYPMETATHILQISYYFKLD
jgi:hypothetical protein